MKGKLAKVLGLDGSAAGARANASKKAEDVDLPWDDAPVAKAKAAAPAPKYDEEEDEDMDSFFKKLQG